MHPCRRFERGRDKKKKKGYNKVRSERDRAHREGALFFLYHLIKMIFICTFRPLLQSSVLAGRYLKAVGRRQKKLCLLTLFRGQDSCSKSAGLGGEFKGVHTLPKGQRSGSEGREESCLEFLRTFFYLVCETEMSVRRGCPLIQSERVSQEDAAKELEISFHLFSGLDEKLRAA